MLIQVQDFVQHFQLPWFLKPFLSSASIQYVMYFFETQILRTKVKCKNIYIKWLPLTVCNRPVQIFCSSLWARSWVDSCNSIYHLIWKSFYFTWERSVTNENRDGKAGLRALKIELDIISTTCYVWRYEASHDCCNKQLVLLWKIHLESQKNAK